MIDLTEILTAIITLIVAIVSTFVIPCLKTKVEAAKLEEVMTWVTVAVEAAEMIYAGTGRGEEKKAYVIKYLNTKGYTLDTDSIDALIESAVLSLKTAT